MMQSNIFSIFDPSTNFFIPLNWLSTMIIFTFLPFQYWILPSRLMMLWGSLSIYIHKEFKTLINHSYSNLIILVTLFIFIMFNNFMGLYPYIFTATSHMSICLPLSLSMWSGMMIFSLFNFFNELCTHLTPQGTPLILMPFMVIIESISLLIRPMTLAVRLTANMIAGHLLMSLIGSAMKSIMMFTLLLISAQTLLLILEIAVAIIQSYVFSILLTLYSSET
ncbi:atp6 (mitochondrion) [Ooceraea biroi]|uniref:ATP synthase subunit a n=1 Tax=Ooceraea biroi TaxID=2015173 RepID=A0A3L8D2Z6_OOCBI|nr:atp6 [Ooceraea biroi]